MKKIFVLLACILVMSSCKKFLEEYSRDLKYVENTADLNKLMIGEAFLPSFSFSVYSQSTITTLNENQGVLAPWLHVMDDDSELSLANYVEPFEQTPRNMLSGFHNWSQQPNANVLNLEWEESFWKKVYKRIGALNAIIFQAEGLAEKNAEDTDLQHIRGEALFLRAYYYFLLQNIYGSPYRTGTAATDEGVPLKISEKIQDDYFKRDHNDVVYKQIIADLDQAAVFLAGYNPATKIRVGIAAVKALQSRVYLFTEQYDKALESSNGFENLGYSLIDLNQYAENTNFTYRNSTESIFTMGPNSVPVVFLTDSTSAWNGDDNKASSFKVSSGLAETYTTDDMRRTAFFRKTAKSKAWIPGKYRTFQTYNDPVQVSCIFSFRYAEIVLNRAEAFAMKGSDAEAREELQKLRIKRVKNASLAQLPQSNEALVAFIRAERRRELCFEGHRWFDLRRYAVNAKYPLPSSFNIKHPNYTYDAQTKSHNPAGNYVLNSFAQDAAAWQVPIPGYAIDFNRGSLTNLIRPVRSVQP
jgi:hypothetical protein